MNCAREARRLANYILSLGDSFETYDLSEEFRYSHMGALYTDVVLQAGVNYNNVVKPRVQNVLLKYPEAFTVKKFKKLIDEEGLENIINWTHSIKLDRFHRLLKFSEENEIDTCSDLKGYLLRPKNQEQLLQLNGIGPKTIDYLMKLLSFDTVAVDRHIYAFINMALINAEGYDVTKKVVEYAADLLEVPRSNIDYSIWKYMSSKNFLKKDNSQLELNFINF